MSRERLEIKAIPGIEDLWSQTRGDSHVCVAVLDGPVDLSHPCFRGARLKTLALGPEGSRASRGPMTAHGTLIASLIFGKHGSEVEGVAPGCRGFLVPVFTDGGAKPTQQDLALAILRAVDNGAHIINISGGQKIADLTDAHTMLADAIQYATEKNVLIVAAAGNDGCECLHAPAALSAVLPVGAMDVHGHPLPESNYGFAYRSKGVLARGSSSSVPNWGVGSTPVSPEPVSLHRSSQGWPPCSSASNSSEVVKPTPTSSTGPSSAGQTPVIRRNSETALDSWLANSVFLVPFKPCTPSRRNQCQIRLNPLTFQHAAANPAKGHPLTMSPF